MYLPANLVLTSTTERYFVSPSNEQRFFADIPRGTYLVRGENVLLIGEIDLDKDDDLPPEYTEAPIADVFTLKKEEEARRKKADKVKSRRAGQLWGGEMEGSGEVLF
jgi:U6 snRNA-associated Sm-like protein LSm1